MEKINKILKKIYKEEEKRKENIEKIWSSLNSSDFLYMENIENFKIGK